MSYQIGIGPNLRKSPYYDATIADGVVSMSVYNHMLTPVHFGDPEGEYRNLIENVVMWDVAVERQVQIEGPDALQLVRYITTREIGDTVIGQGKYIPICDYDGMLINDPVLLRVADDCYWLS
ncbi:MAG: glycine cleavage system protein T, partial [Gammaproteobacteria bacterium]|nr:glycine cleavage system protein T [Gammaproteobacteria bacterium]